MFNYFTKRRTKHENYKIVKLTRINRQKIYHVQFKEWLIGWTTFQEKYDSVTDIEKVFETKDNAKLFIEQEISKAYNKLRK